VMTGSAQYALRWREMPRLDRLTKAFGWSSLYGGGVGSSGHSGVVLIFREPVCIDSIIGEFGARRPE
jgi:hypothetical protein